MRTARAIRLTWNLATVGLVFLGVGVIGLRLRSQHAADICTLTVARRQLAVNTTRGFLQVSYRWQTGQPTSESFAATDLKLLMSFRDMTSADEADASSAPLVGGRIWHYEVDRTGLGWRSMYLPVRRIGLWWESFSFDDGFDLSPADQDVVRSVGGFHNEDLRDRRFDVVVHPTYLTRHVRKLVMPLWEVAAVIALAPVTRGLWAAGRWWRRRRTPPGHCGRCGYDLRASPGRCPECGAAATARP